MQKGLALLLDKYGVREKAEMTADGRAVCVNGQTVPLLPWESERRIAELRTVFLSGRIGRLCTFRIGHTAPAGVELSELLAREIGILEYAADSEVKEIFAVAGRHTMNCIAETASGCVCTIELGATLRPGEEAIDKHEMIGDRGVACDRAVDTQIPQQSVYVFGGKKSMKSFLFFRQHTPKSCAAFSVIKRNPHNQFLSSVVSCKAVPYLKGNIYPFIRININLINQKIN